MLLPRPDDQANLGVTLYRIQHMGPVEAGMPSYEIQYALEPAKFFADATTPARVIKSRDLRGVTPITGFQVEGPRVRIHCSASDKQAALQRATDFIEGLTRLLSMKTARYVSARFEGLDNTSGKPGDSILNGLDISWWEEDYDARNRLPADIGSACRAISHLGNPTIEPALSYYQRGVFYRRELFRLVELDLGPSQNQFYLAEAALNFYKATAIVLGHPIHEPTKRALRLDRTQRKRVENLYDLRNRFDIAHPVLDSAALETVKAQVYHAQTIAKEVVEIAVEAAERGEVVEWPPVYKSGRQRR